jgi:hypothetical protein
VIPKAVAETVGAAGGVLAPVAAAATTPASRKSPISLAYTRLHYPNIRGRR